MIHADRGGRRRRRAPRRAGRAAQRARPAAATWAGREPGAGRRGGAARDARSCSGALTQAAAYAFGVGFAGRRRARRGAQPVAARRSSPAA